MIFDPIENELMTPTKHTIMMSSIFFNSFTLHSKLHYCPHKISGQNSSLLKLPLASFVIYQLNDFLNSYWIENYNKHWRKYMIFCLKYLHFQETMIFSGISFHHPNCFSSYSESLCDHLLQKQVGACHGSLSYLICILFIHTEDSPIYL